MMKKAEVMRENPSETRLLTVQATKPDVIYECVLCGRRTTLSELEYCGSEVKCPYCGYRVLKKTRPPIVKRVRAV